MTTTHTQGANAGEDDLTALTATMVQRMEGLFAPFRGTWDEEALIDYGLDFAREAVGKVELAKGQLSTFVCTVVKRRLLDLHRTLRRGQKRIDAHGATRQYLSEGRAFEDVDEGLPVDQYVCQVYRQAVHTVGRRPSGRGPRIYAPAQDVALVALARKLKMSYREVILWLEENPKMLTALGISGLPSHQKIFRLCNRFRGITANHRASRRVRSNRMAADHITERQAAAIVTLSPGTIARWRRNNDAGWIKPYRLGRRRGPVRYLRSEVLKWMEAQAVKPTCEGAT